MTDFAAAPWASIPSMGRSFGKPGGTLLGGDTSWAANKAVAKFGAAGEQRVGTAIERALAHDASAVVLHDLSIPGLSANIDHIVVRGHTVTIVDAKAWSAGRYFTLFGRTFRIVNGTRAPKRFEPADKTTMEIAARNIAGYLNKHGCRHKMERPIIVVTPQRPGRISVRWLRVPGARSITIRQLSDRGGRVFPATRERRNDEQIIVALSGLVRRN